MTRLLVRATLTAAVVAVAVGCSSAPSDPGATLPPPASVAPTPAALDPYYQQQLAWRDCEGGFECSELTVPKDYADPAKGDTRVAVLREPGDKPLGSLVVNPGGPGGSGVDYARAAKQVFSRQVTDNYSVVGFDPRGVGRSSAIDCVTDAQLDDWIATDGDPATPADEKDLMADAKAFGAACEKKSGDLLPFISTESVVKDMDVLRAALGEDRLNFVGFSYGTMLGALYADEFGETSGRMVLDGVLPPSLTSEEITLGQARGFEDALRRYVADCQKQSDCPVAGDSVDAGIKKIQDLLTGLEEKPLPAGDGEQLTQALAAGAILYYLYFPSAGDWDSLSKGLTDAFAGDGSTLLELYRTRLERDSDGKYRNNAQEAFFAVTCLDRDEELTTADLAARADEWAQEAPTFGRYLAWSEAACAQWPIAGQGEPRQVTAAEAGPIVIIGNTHDPATPLPWAQRLADSMADAHLIVWDADGHTAYGNGSQCVQDAVDAYLVDGTLPEPDLVCE